MPHASNHNPDQILDTIHMVATQYVQHDSRVKRQNGRPQLGLMLSDEADSELLTILGRSPTPHGWIGRADRHPKRFDRMSYRGIDYTAISLDDPTVMVSLHALKVFTNEGLQVYLMPFIQTPEAN